MVQNLDTPISALSRNTWIFPPTDCSIVTGDTPATTWGDKALRLDGICRFESFQGTFEMNPVGQWRAAFWARSAPGASNATLQISPPTGTASNIPLDSTWTYYELPFQLSGSGWFEFRTTSHPVLLDDVVTWKVGDATNPTAFRDELVASIRSLSPGPLRRVRLGGETIENAIRPVMQKSSWRATHDGDPAARIAVNRDEYGLHDLYTLCEHTGCTPWYCLPGTLTREEMTGFLEYLGAPTNVGMGALRAELGHPQPWTEVFDYIHIEFANEPYTYKGPSYYGPDYWHDLVATGKSSPHYRSNILFRASQVGAATVVDNAPNMDMYCKALYVCFNVWSNQIAALQNTPEKMCNWGYGQVLNSILDSDGKMRAAFETVNAAGLQFGSYEGNYHTSYGSPVNLDGSSTIPQREWLTVSAGGAVGYLNGHLLMLREFGARHQTYFNHLQYRMAGFGGTFPRGWGAVLSMRSDNQRMRPFGYALQLINAALEGDLVQTAHTGPDIQFMAAGPYNDGIGKYVEAETNYYPVLWSYACRDGAWRSLIVVNLDTVSNQEIVVTLPNEPDGYTCESWLLTSSHITNINEDFSYDVTSNTVMTLSGFGSGTRITIPRASMQSFIWMESATNPPPLLIEPPTNTSAEVGTAATLTSRAIGASPLRYQWEIGEAGRIVGATNSALQLEDVQWEDADEYRVLVSNADGSATSGWATLTVLPEPTALLPAALFWMKWPRPCLGKYASPPR
jgi:hypothetical protein